MGQIASALTAVTEALAAAMPEVDVAEHPGRFTEDELGKYAMKQQAVRVAVEQVPAFESRGDGLRQASVRFVAFVICTDIRGQDRHQAALDIAEDIGTSVVFSQWNQPERFRAVAPDEVEITNLYSGPLSNGRGIAWWAVTWTQQIKATNKEF